VAAFLAKKAELDAPLAELAKASEDHFGANPEAVLWAEAAWLSDATTKLQGHRGGVLQGGRILCRPSLPA